MASRPFVALSLLLLLMMMMMQCAYGYNTATVPATGIEDSKGIASAIKQYFKRGMAILSGIVTLHEGQKIFDDATNPYRATGTQCGLVYKYSCNYNSDSNKCNTFCQNQRGYAGGCLTYNHGRSHGCFCDFGRCPKRSGKD